MLGRDLLLAGKHACCASEVYIDAPALYALDDSGDNLPAPLIKLGHRRRALRFADALYHDLLCRLCGDSPVIFFGLKGEYHFFAKLGIFFHFLRVLKEDMVFRVKADALLAVYLFPDVFRVLSATRGYVRFFLRLLGVFFVTHLDQALVKMGDEED